MNIPKSYEALAADLASEKIISKTLLGQKERYMMLADGRKFDLDSLQQRLTVAEQLAADLKKLLCDVINEELTGFSSLKVDLANRVNDALNPAEHPQCEECKGWGYHENHHEGGGTECGECGGSGNATVAVEQSEFEPDAICLESDGCPTEGAVLKRFWRENQPDPVLCEFYEAECFPSLVRELVGHIAQLQDAAKRNVKPWEDTFPPTLLPAYIARINAEQPAPVAVVMAGQLNTFCDPGCPYRGEPKCCRELVEARNRVKP